MAKLIWGASGQRTFEAGADRGVLYLNNRPGVSWSGLVSVEENTEGGSARPFYIDGFKYENLSEATEFEATLSALSSPTEFDACDGFKSLGNGLVISNQARQTFGLSYRTLIGNDTDGLALGYKIHLVYNALAAPTSRSNATLSDSPEALTLSWDISTRPIKLPGVRPTAHLVIDSTKADKDLLNLLEAYLYGANGMTPKLPSALQLLTLFNSWKPLGLTTSIKLRGSSSAEYTTFRNLATNPSFEATSGTVEVRRNLWTDPLATSAGGYSVLDGTLSPVTTPTPFGTTALALTTSADSATAYKTMAGLALPVGTYTLSAYFYLTAKAGAMVRARVGGAGVINGDSGVWVTHNGDWQRVSVTFSVVEGHGALPQVAASELAVGDTVYFTGILLEASPTLQPFFSGSYSPDTDLTPSWTGTPNASPSILTGASVADIATTRCVAIRSTRWSKSGASSMRLIPTGSPGDPPAIAYYLPAGGSRTGKTDTMLATVHLETPLLDAANAQMYLEGGSGIGNFTDIANVAGDQDLRVRSYRSGSTTASMFMLPSARGNGDVWVDCTATVEGDYTGPYFDGSQPPALAKNLASDPAATTNGTVAGQARWTPRWFGAGGAGSTTLVSGAADGPEIVTGARIPTYMRKTWTTGGSIGDTGFDHTEPASTSGLPVTAGQAYTFSSHMRASRNPGGGTEFLLRASFHDATGAQVGPAHTAATALVAGPWARLSTSLTAPAGAATVSLASDVIGGGSWQAGDTLDGTGLLVQESATLNNYIDGSMVDGMWLGAENASTSIRYDTRQRVSWEGAVNASPSKLEQLSILKVPTEPGEAFLIDNDLWVYEKNIWRNLGVIPGAIT